jgi:hypothetical protein
MRTDPLDEKIQQGDIASAATMTAYHSTFPDGQTPTKANFQLDEWLEAKRLFLEVSTLSSVNVGHLVPIVNRLGNSLTTLCGQQYRKSGRAPCLREYVDDYFPTLGWHLASDDPALYQDFLILDSDHKKLTKHLTAAKITELSQLTYVRVRQHMDTTRRIWLWLLAKLGGNRIPPDQELHFRSIE